jgi:hypothetical protein
MLKTRAKGTGTISSKRLLYNETRFTFCISQFYRTVKFAYIGSEFNLIQVRKNKNHASSNLAFYKITQKGTEAHEKWIKDFLDFARSTNITTTTDITGSAT